MSDEDVLRVGGVTAQLSVKIASSVAQASVADNLHHGLCKLIYVYGELVCIPSVLRVTAVCVDAAQKPVVHSHCKLVLKSVAGQGGVVYLYVHLEVLVKPVGAKETNHGFSIGVVLVLGRLHRLRLNEEGALEALRAGIVAGCAEHLCQMVLLPLHLGVEKAAVALAAAPENVIGAAQFYCGVDGVLYLYGCPCNYVKVRIGGCSVHVALVAEDIGRAPEQLYSGLFHLESYIVCNLLHAGLVFLYRSTLFNKVYIVEAKILYSKLLHDFKACIGLVLGTLQGSVGLVPLVGTGLASELVA